MSGIKSDPAVTLLSGAGEGNPDQTEAAVEAPPEANPEVVKPAETSKPTETTETESPEVTPSQNDVPVAPVSVEQQATSTVEQQHNTVPAQNGEAWQQREAELLKVIENLESVQGAAGVDKMSFTLKAREDEIELLRARVSNLETELQAALSKPGGKNQEMIDNIKLQHEDLLSKARGMIFDKTKMVKNQELQIEALTTQVQSLKDINAITKDLLDIRNQEVKAMEDRFQVMELKHKAEKEKHGLVLQRAETSSGLNEDLKKEYETQLGLFKHLRVKYEERVQALIAENERLKEQINASTT